MNMIEYIKNIVANFPEEITMLKTSPALNHLFEVREELKAKSLLEEKVMAFHHTTIQLIIISACTRHDIQPTTTFLTTQVKSPDEDNWGRVKQVLGYLKGTMNMPLILLTNSLTLS
jgi:hypothetical protein